MNAKKKGGDFYASKVRLYLNEYNGISLEDFCKAENVSYNKMCHCLGRPSYRKDKVAPSKSRERLQSEEPVVPVLPEMALRPLVIDRDCEGVDVGQSSTAADYLSCVRLRTPGQTEVVLGTCPVKVLASLIKEMEGASC